MNSPIPLPRVRPRRLRRTAALRRLVGEVDLDRRRFIQPLFFKEGLSASEPVPSMPNVWQHDAAGLLAAARAAVEAGVGGLMLFAVPQTRDGRGSPAVDPNGALNMAVRMVADEVGGDTVVMADLCLDEFTDHGHCGVLDSHGCVDNDETLSIYAEMAVTLAQAGADVVAPSGMMDGQVRAVRAALDLAGHTDTVILAYSAKYASAYYGPFRDAVDSSLQGDRRTYQQDPANRREALREVQLDIDEGADMVMVKPASGYLDVLADVAALSSVPVLAYQVSGEMAMVEAAAERGWLDREAMILETLTGIHRAGADAILTYWATEVARWL